jgi:predicted 3-demethylubiquinone-9 3-methyltransferase (glyoxalase superfamily)
MADTTKLSEHGLLDVVADFDQLGGLRARPTPIGPASDEFWPGAESKWVTASPDGRTKMSISPCLWFDTQGEEAAAFYTSVFPDSRILEVSRYGEAGPRPAGTAMMVSFELNGQRFLALNGGPQYTFNEAISFTISCADQEEVDHYWSRLSEDGEEGPCGWLKDRYGVSWQVVPDRLPELLADPDPEVSQRVMGAMLQMRKIEIPALEAAATAARAQATGSRAGR